MTPSDNCAFGVIVGRNERGAPVLRGLYRLTGPGRRMNMHRLYGWYVPRTLGEPRVAKWPNYEHPSADIIEAFTPPIYTDRNEGHTRVSEVTAYPRIRNFMLVLDDNRLHWWAMADTIPAAFAFLRERAWHVDDDGDLFIGYSPSDLFAEQEQ